MTSRIASHYILSAPPIDSVTVEFDGRSGRERKTFAGRSAVSASRRFYAEKMKAGKNPKIVKGDSRPA